MAIGGSGAPYVHSNIDNWVQGELQTVPPLTEGRKIDESIATLTSIRQQLFDKANEFLTGDTVEFMNYCIDNEYKSYADIAVQILQDPDAISALMLGDTSVRMSQKDVRALLNTVPERLDIFKFIKIDEIESIGARTLAIEIADVISDAEMQLTVDGATFVRDLYKSAIGQENNDGLSNAFLKEITGVTVGQLKSGGTSSRIVDAIEAIIEKTNLYQKQKGQKTIAKDSVESFMNWFKSIFIPKAKQVVRFFSVDQTPEQYVEDFEKKIREKIKKNFKDIMNTVGALGDEIIVSAYQADARTAVLGITLESIGSVHEEDVVKKYGETFSGVKTMLTHHELNKQSQTDILIKNKNGMVARVQAKNASLRNAQYSNNGLINLGAHLQRERDLKALLEALEIPNTEEIIETVANASWFSGHVSVSGKRSKGQLDYSKAKVNADITGDLQRELSIFFSTKAENFIGITIDTAVKDETKMISGASNLFYLKNGRFIPTYTLVDEVIKDLIDYKQDALTALHGLSFNINQRGISWEYGKAVEFWKAKAQNDFSNAHSVGTAQGAKAASSLVVTGNFNKVYELSSLVINTDA